MSFTTKNNQKARFKLASLMYVVFALALVAVLWGGPSKPVSAVANNTDNNISADVLRILRNASQNVDKPYVNNYGGPNLTVKSPPCATKNGKPIYHFQFPWLSPVGKPTVNSSLTVEQGVDSVSLQYNRVAGYCHYVFTSVLPLKNSKIVDDSKLQVTGTRLTDYSAVVVGKESDVKLDISGLSTTKDLEIMNYEYARTNSLRFVKDGDKPYADTFNLSGLKALSAGNYNVKITLKARLVNRFGAGSSASYKCVAGAASTSASRWSTDCPISESSFIVKVNIPKEYEGSCTISGVPETIDPGQSFNATFTVSNKGSKDWLVEKPATAANYFKLRPASDKWGKNPVFITGPGKVGTNLPSKKTTTFTESFKAPNDVVPNFSWKLVHDGAGGGLGTIATCNSDVNSKLNKPFLRVSGGDVVAGAQFTNTEVDEDVPQTTRVNGGYGAPINTNGTSKALGASSSEYAVFASGFIDSLGGAFYGNNFYMRSSGVGDRKDLMFANTEVSESTGYGKFYGGSEDISLPDVDISKLVQIAKKNTDPTIAGMSNKNDVFKKYLSDTVGDTPPAYFTGDYTVSNFNQVDGSKILVIDGNLTIGANLPYNSASTKSPNLILVVLGNINVKSNVTQLDGTYIAFPTTEDNGVFNTCSDVDESAGLTTATSNCGNKLTITGRLVASKVLWRRTYGTIQGSRLPGSCLYSDSEAGYESCAAEFIDFSPNVYFNSPLDSTETHTNTGPSNVPTGTLDLPPIY